MAKVGMVTKCTYQAGEQKKGVEICVLVILVFDLLDMYKS
jgi:hypothetical protein